MSTSTRSKRRGRQRARRRQCDQLRNKKMRIGYSESDNIILSSDRENPADMIYNENRVIFSHANHGLVRLGDTVICGERKKPRQARAMRNAKGTDGVYRGHDDGIRPQKVEKPVDMGKSCPECGCSEDYCSCT